MSTQRDELAMELFIVDNHNQPREQSIADWHLCIVSPRFAVGIKHYRSMAEGAIAAGYGKPRTITTVAELDALPVGSVVMDNREYVGHKARNNELPNWEVTLHKFSKETTALDLPATVLYEPTA